MAGYKRRARETDHEIVSWNVNGIRAAAKKGFGSWLSQSPAQFIGLQEFRALSDQVPNELLSPEGWHVQMNPAERKGYSGVAIYCRREPDRIETSLGEERFDSEGRLQIAWFGPLVIANVYFPNGSGKDRDNSRVPYKLDFYRALFEVLEHERAAGRRVLVMGDFNTAHRPIDIARPKSNEKTSGFLIEERDEITRWLNSGWIDTYRVLHGEVEGAYSWWSQRGGARQRNVGWRIDYVLACPAAMEFVSDAFIRPDVTGSDHCPVGVKVRQKIWKR